jgi:hypothetical protein
MKIQKKTYLIFLCIAVLLILGLTPRWGNAIKLGPVSISWASDIDIPTAKDLKIHKLVSKSIDKDKFVQLSNRILERVEPNAQLRRFVNFNEVQEVTDKVTLRFMRSEGEEESNKETRATKLLSWSSSEDPTSFILQDSRNGDLIFQNQMSRFTTMSNIDLPSKIGAISAAEGFIEDVGLLPGDFNTNGELLATTALFQQEFKDGAYGNERQLLFNLYYGREIDGIQVEGPGSRMFAQIGHDGRVVSFIKKWNDFSPLLKITPTTALQNLQGSAKGSPQFNDPTSNNRFAATAGGGSGFAAGTRQTLRRYTAPTLKLTPYFSEQEIKDKLIDEIETSMESAKLVEVKDVSLVYYDRSGEYIRPAYAIELKIHYEEGELDYLFHMAALRNPPEAVGYVALSLDEVAYIPKPTPPPKGMEGIDMEQFYIE